MKEKNPAAQPDHGLEKWPGYSISDLRYQRAINHVRMEMEHERLANSMTRIGEIKNKAGFGGSGLVSKIFTGFTVLDYALLAFTAGKQVRKIYRLFKK